MEKIELGERYGIEAELSGDLEYGREVVGCVTYNHRPIFDICAAMNEDVVLYARTAGLWKRHIKNVFRLILGSTDGGALLYTIREGVERQSYEVDRRG